MSRCLQEVVIMTGATSAKRSSISSLRSLAATAYLADPSDRLISPVGERSYSTVFGLIPATLAVLRMAAMIEPDPPTMLAWYREIPIAELGSLTAEQLVMLGRAEAVVAFLQSVRDGARD
jgi:hypothetical protein